MRVRAKRGVARLAIDGRATVIPVGAWIDERDIVPKQVTYRYQGQLEQVTSWFPRFRARYGVVFGRPMSMEEYFGRELSLDDYQEAATRILDRIYELEEEAATLFEGRSSQGLSRQTLEVAAAALVLPGLVVLPDRLDLGVGLQLRVGLGRGSPRSSGSCG